MPEERMTESTLPSQQGVDVSMGRSSTRASLAQASQREKEHRAAAVVRMILIGVVLAPIAAVPYVVLYFQTQAWQMPVDAAALVLGIVCLVPAYRLARRGKLDAAGYWILLAVMTVYGIGELVWADATWSQIASVVLLMILVGSVIRPRKWGVWLIVAGLYGVYVFVINRFEPLPRYAIMATQPATQLINIPLALAVFWQVTRVFRMGTIRARLLFAFLLIGVLPVLVIGAAGVLFSWQSGRQRTIEQLKLEAAFKRTEIDAWLDGLQADLDAALAREGVEDVARVLLLGAISDAEVYQDVSGDLMWRLYQHLEQTQRLEELFLLNSEGRVLLSTDALRRGQGYGDQAFFEEGLKGPYVHPLFYSTLLGQESLIVARPVFDQIGNASGVLCGRASVTALDEIMRERVGSSETTESYLLGSNHVALTGLRVGEDRILVHTPGSEAAVKSQGDGYGFYDNYFSVPVIGVYRWLPDLGVALLVEQEQAEAFRGAYISLAANVGIALAVMVVAVVVALLVTRGIANPLADLAGAAIQIAGGELDLVARVEREDEVGAMARAFNSMTAQLRDSIGGLEQRVSERTRDLERRSSYLEAAAEVGRTASSILDADQLIQQVVELIREQFDLYYVGLFLLDERGEWAVLRAGTGEAGRAMLARNHRIQVGEGMIGWSVANAQARIALDVGVDAVRLTTEELPGTRSEAALPLRSRGRVSGALTVQSDQPGVFEGTLVVLQTMADLVAVALDNAYLFAEREETLEAASRAYGELSREAWAELLRARPDLGFRSDERGVERAGDMWRPEMERAFREGQTICVDTGEDVEKRRSLAVPIKLGGDVIGVLDTYKPGDAGTWTSEQVELLEKIAGQLSLALENARLYENTQRLGIREQQLREIGTRMQSTFDLDILLRTVVEDLAKALKVPSAFVQLTSGGTLPSEE